MVHQQHISDEKFKAIKERYLKFIETMHDPNQEPIKVFNPLGQKQLEELEMIREVSKDLQAKKEEDMRKAAEDKKDKEIEAQKEKEKEAEEKAKETAAEEEEPKKEE